MTKPRRRKARKYQLIVNETGSMIELREFVNGDLRKLMWDNTYKRLKVITLREVLPKGGKR